MADYVIQRGDTLGAIAARLGTTVQALAQANGIANPDRIQAGATLRVPDQPMMPTTGAMPVPRPERTQVAAASPPLPVSNPARASSTENYAQPYRPYNIGERVNNADGTWSSERSMTVENPIMGGYSVIPSMYRTDNGPLYLTDNPALNSQAAFTYAQRTGTMPQTFPTLDQAENYAVQREANWQDPATAGRNAPLFNPVPAPNPARTQVAGPPPLPVSNPTRQANVGAPLPRPRPVTPQQPDTSAEDIYNQPGLSPQQVQQYQGQGQWVTPSAPRPPGNGVGIQTAAVERGNPLPAPPAEPIQVTTLPQRQLEQLLTLGAARQLPPDLYRTVQMEMQRRTEMMRIEAERAQQMAAIQAEADRSRNMQFDAPAYRAENGTSPRAIPPGQQPSIGEGEYLPAEMIRLGQLGANMNSAPRANTMLPTLGLLSGPRRQPQTLGNLAYTGV